MDRYITDPRLARVVETLESYPRWALYWTSIVAMAALALGAKELQLHGVFQPGEGRIRHQAIAGDAKAMYKMGELYLSGKGGLPENTFLALDWFQKAANAGNADGAFLVASAYRSGIAGFPSDRKKAVHWDVEAALGGNPYAMADLARSYSEGEGRLPKDESSAVIWYRRSAAGGSADGMAGLAHMYEHGSGGLPKDVTQAVEWYRKAAEAKGEFNVLGAFTAKAELNRLGYSNEPSASAKPWWRRW